MQAQDLFHLLANGFTGLSELPGSCGTRLMLTPRRRLRRFADQSLITSPLRTIRPASRRALSASRPIMACAVVVFPEPDSPTKASISPRWMEKLTLCTTSRHSPPRAVADAQIFNGQNVHGRTPLHWRLRRLAARTTATTARPGKVVSHQAVDR